LLRGSRGVATERRGARADPGARERANARSRRDRVRESSARRGGRPREQTLLAARRAGPNGYVLATGIPPRVLAGRAGAARHARPTNIETRVMDARRLDLDPESFDAAISRLALMLIPERERALAGIRRALKPGKKFAAIVVSTADKSPRLALPLAIVGRRAGLPSAPFGDPGMFALGDPGVLQAAYERAGFRDVSVAAIALE